MYVRRSVAAAASVAEISEDELAEIPLYPGRGTDSLEWFEEHWAPLVRAGRVWQHHVREHDERLFNALRKRLYDQGTAIWTLLPPEPGRGDHARRKKRK